MLYYVKNESGNVSDVTEEMYKYLKTKPEYECWTEDPYESLPEAVDEIAKPTEDNTRDEIKEYLDEVGVDYDPYAKKADLLDLV